MPVANAIGADGKGGQILQVVDFRAGIVNNSTVYNAPFVRVNTIGSPLSLSQVTAAIGTVNCMAMGNGGLAPMPQPQLWSLPPTQYTGVYYNALTGFPMQLLGGITYTENYFGTETVPIETAKSIIAAIRTESPGSFYPLTALYEYNLTSQTWNKICDDGLWQPTTANTGYLSPLFPFVTYWQSTNSPFSTKGYMDPTIICSTWPMSVRLGEVTSNSVLVYDMALTTAKNALPSSMTNAHSPFVMANGRKGVAFTNQLRTGFWEDIGNGVDNVLSYIDPVLSNWQASTNPNSGSNPDFQKQYEVFQVNNPSSVGAWGSVTSGDLLVITMSQGAYIINGDFFSPTVTMMPGVQSTNGEIGASALTPLGLVYASGDNGVWVWDGGAVAQKLSTQLSDNFYKATVGPSTPPNSNYAQGAFFSCLADGDLIFVSNNWVYNMTLGSWWQILSQVGYPYMWYAAVPDNIAPNTAGSRSHRVYMAPAVFNDNDDNVGAFWDKNVPALYWQWNSNPFLLDDSYYFDVSEFWIQLSSPGNGGFFQINLTDATTGIQFLNKQITTATSGPEWFRFPTNATPQSFTVDIIANNESGADPLVPLICYGFDIVFKTRRKVAVS